MIYACPGIRAWNFIVVEEIIQGALINLPVPNKEVKDTIPFWNFQPKTEPTGRHILGGQGRPQGYFRAIFEQFFQEEVTLS